MKVFKPSQLFSFSYPAYDQNPSLFVGFSIYDVSTGTPSFVEMIPAVYTAFGVYVSSYTGVTNI